MSKEALAIDIDEVVFPFMPNFLVHHNDHNQTSLTAEKFKTYKFEVDMSIPMEEAISHVYSFNGSDHSHIYPHDESVVAIEKLAGQFELNLVTARHPQFETNTQTWIDRHFEDAFNSVTFIGYAAIMEKPVTKAEVCDELGAIALIDDSIEHVSLCAEQGIEGVLFGEYPWNQTDELPDGVTRCRDWPAVLEHFNV